MKNNIDKFLDVFMEDIKMMSEHSDPDNKNVVLAGSNVLLLHGLNITWDPQDLDVAVYMPTPQQELFIRSGSFESCLDYNEDEKEESDQLKLFPDVRAWKIEKSGLVMNFIMERHQEKPQINLLYPYRGMLFQVNSVNTIIDAKLSYGDGIDKSFVRRKDGWHLSELKNANFNITPLLKK